MNNTNPIINFLLKDKNISEQFKIKLKEQNSENNRAN